MKTWCCLLLLTLCGSCASLKSAKHPPPELRILSRAEWGAQSPVGGMKRHEPVRITIHHTAVRQNPGRALADKLQALQKFSQNAGTLGNGRPKLPWPDVPYHYYIAANGEVAEGREVQFVGDTNTEYDPTGHALVVLEGNFEEESVTASQWASLTNLVRWLAQRFDVPPDRIGGHQDFAQTLCPGKDLQQRLPDLRHAVR